VKVLLTGRFGAAERAQWLQALAAAAPGVHWLDEAQAQADPGAVQAAVVANPAPGALQGLPALRLVQSLWAGVDRLLADPTLPAGVPLARMVDPAMSAAMAETALWAVLALQRGFFDYAQQQREGLWRLLPQRRADETPVAVLGLGAMGAAAAAALVRQGFPVAAWVREPGGATGSTGAAATTAAAGRTDAVATRPVPAGVALHAGAAALPALLAGSAIVVNLLPLTPATQGLVDAAFLARLPRGAALVNLARGAHVVEPDLLAALDTGQLAHAVLDVFATEPLPPGHPFWRHRRVTVLPHAAALTDPRSAAAVVAANLRAVAVGREPAHQVLRDRGY
jgi:glyoxylate/hydroxypyruvate reductase A